MVAISTAALSILWRSRGGCGQAGALLDELTGAVCKTRNSMPRHFLLFALPSHAMAAKRASTLDSILAAAPCELTLRVVCLRKVVNAGRIRWEGVV